VGERRAVGVETLQEIATGLSEFLLVECHVDTGQDQAAARAQTVHEHHESARGGLAQHGPEFTGGRTVEIELHQLAREYLRHPETAVRHENHVEGHAEFARALSFATDGP